MSLTQENFDRAMNSGEASLQALRLRPTLSRESKQRLQTWLWDLEAIGAAIRHELMNREDDRPIDLG